MVDYIPAQLHRMSMYMRRMCMVFRVQIFEVPSLPLHRTAA